MSIPIKQTLFYKLLGKKAFVKKLAILKNERAALIPDDCNEYVSPMDKRQITFLDNQIKTCEEIIK